MPSTDELKDRLAQACRVLGTLELAKATTGHVSVRDESTGRILVRARGPQELGVRYTTPDEIIEIDRNGRATGAPRGGLEPPLEIFIHTELYKARPDIACVVHMHPEKVVLLTACELPLLPLYGSYDPPSAQMALDPIPLYDRSVLITTPELGAELSHTMGSCTVCLMRGHGITCVGSSIEQASLAAIHLNDLASFNYQARLLGSPIAISDDDQTALRSLTSGPARMPGSGPSGRELALWRYYCKVTGA